MTKKELSKLLALAADMMDEEQYNGKLTKDVHISVLRRLALDLLTNG